MRGKGVQFLNELFESLKIQTFKDFEVIVSDHSKNNAIKELCQKWQKIFDLQYIPYADHRGDPVANRRNAESAARGDIIKPMDQDDFMYSKDCLLRIDEALRLNPKFAWGIIGYIHTNESADTFYKITHSSDVDLPRSQFKSSVTFYKRTVRGPLFTPRIHTLIVSGALIAIRVWPFQFSNYVKPKQLNVKERRQMILLSVKRTVRKYILNPLDKITHKLTS